MLMSKYTISKDHIVLHKELNPSRRSDPVGSFSRDWLFPEGNNQFELLVKKATQWDETVKYLELGDPNHALFENARSVIAGYRARETDLTNQLTDKDKKIAELTQEVQNRIEQLARETTALLRDKKAVESAYEESQNQMGVEKRLRKEVEGQLDTIAKELGKAKNELAACKASTGTYCSPIGRFFNLCR